MEVSKLTKKRIEELLKKGKRLDGRGPFDFRELVIETGISCKAEGSARVKLGDTEVIVGVKLGIMEPYTDSPDAGVMMVISELWPLASEKFEMGPPDLKSIELSRLVDRGIRESEFIDFKKLCVKKGELVWNVFIDIYPINDAGNLIDASALAAVMALKTAVMPKLKDDKIQYGEFTNKHLPLNEDKMPLTLTFYKVGNKFILDPSVSEEESAKVRFTFAFSLDKKKTERIHASQKALDEPLDEKEIYELLDSAKKEYKNFLGMVSKAQETLKTKKSK